MGSSLPLLRQSARLPSWDGAVTMVAEPASSAADVQSDEAPLLAPDEPNRMVSAAPGPKPRFYSPFLHRDYVLLYLINVAEFFSSTLSNLTLLQWLFEATGSGLALGGLGVVTLCVNVPCITLGGVLADEMDRKKLISQIQSAQFIVLIAAWLLSWTEIMQPWHVYAIITVLTAARQLEGSARGVLTASCVPRDVLPFAISVNIAPGEYVIKCRYSSKRARKQL